MKNSVAKTAKIFIKNKLKNRTDFDSVQNYLKTQGYAVEFYAPEGTNHLIENLGLGEYSKQVQAFTAKRGDLKMVFIQSSASPEDKRYLLLHETAHIVLNHLETNFQTSNSRLQDIEADAFVYAVMNATKDKSVSKLILTCLIVFCVVFGVQFFRADNKVTYKETASKENIVTTSAEKADERVLVSPAGTKFHRPDCRYVKNKTCELLSRTEALEKFAPCSVCKP